MKHRLVDTHCHPQFPQYAEDREAVIRRSIDGGIAMVCVGTDYQTSTKAVELAQSYEGLYASVGWHPNDHLDSSPDIETFIPLCSRFGVVAIGEVGLDYYRTPDPADRRKQAERFVIFSSLAKQQHLPLIIHCRDAHDDMRALLDRDIPSVIHSFNGDIDTARKYLDFGCLIGLNAIITYAPQYQEMVRMIPSDRVLVETDAPYLAPAPHRGARNEPSYVEIVASALAHMRSTPVDDFYSQTTENAISFFGLK